MLRRDFIRKTAATGAFTAFGALALESCIETKGKQITILHTNDVHSHILPFAKDHQEYADLGGIARRASLIEKVRNENKNTLLFDAGDIFQGTPFFNFFGGEVEFKLMSKLGYNASTLGNHDFDNGIEGLDKQLPNATFDFVISNYNFKNTVLDGKTKPFQIYTLDGVKIGVFGLGIELNGLVTPSLYKETEYLNPIEISQEMVEILKNREHCDIIICLSHLGYYYKSNPDKISDLNLAKQTKNIDLIIGGHTHTFLPKPTLVKNLDDKNVLVNQVGKWGINVGRIDFYLDSFKNISANGTQIILN
ncbi:bifunctional metallophosphatase/5'-nucleotidase [Namhaeicola litoreus]|uniref:Bifunctional metallophosphatase/5'-nucleotidase n=1 Tax=Namhaeicola litoreus TaxID=1052145 RepID=A0ABW3Y3R7_9FLAO